ncbi:MAG: hypothetical protein ACRDWD_04645 [Acidimicrobiia bacterium]
MQPFERLRYVARSGGDDVMLVGEAADCLADFGDDPASLVVACRRLLSHHPAAGVLWWLCARVLVAPLPDEAAFDAARLVASDRTADRLGALLPFPHDDPIAVLGWPSVAGAALVTRPDLDVVAIRMAGERRLAARLRRLDQPVRVVDGIDAAALAPSHLLVETTAASPSETLVPGGATELLDATGAAGWLVAGVGRVLPARLFASLQAALPDGDDDPDDFEVVSVERFERIAGPTGLQSPDQLARRVDAPVAPELMRLGR